MSLRRWVKLGGYANFKRDFGGLLAHRGSVVGCAGAPYRTISCSFSVKQRLSPEIAASPKIWKA
jgi:hypothetical protein